jgi:hypothetical protein
LQLLQPPLLRLLPSPGQTPCRCLWLVLLLTLLGQQGVTAGPGRLQAGQLTKQVA